MKRIGERGLESGVGAVCGGAGGFGRAAVVSAALVSRFGAVLLDTFQQLCRGWAIEQAAREQVLYA